MGLQYEQNNVRGSPDIRHPYNPISEYIY